MSVIMSSWPPTMRRLPASTGMLRGVQVVARGGARDGAGCGLLQGVLRQAEGQVPAAIAQEAARAQATLLAAAPP
jgi:hypothetical protein